MATARLWNVLRIAVGDGCEHCDMIGIRETPCDCLTFQLNGQVVDITAENLSKGADYEPREDCEDCGGGGTRKWLCGCMDTLPLRVGKKRNVMQLASVGQRIADAMWKRKGAQNVPMYATAAANFKAARQALEEEAHAKETIAPGGHAGPGDEGSDDGAERHPERSGPGGGA